MIGFVRDVEAGDAARRSSTIEVRIGAAGAAVVGVAYGMGRFCFGLTLPDLRVDPERLHARPAYDGALPNVPRLASTLTGGRSEQSDLLMHNWYRA